MNRHIFLLLLVVYVVLACVSTCQSTQIIAFTRTVFPETKSGMVYGSIWIWRDGGYGECLLATGGYFWALRISPDASSIAYSWSSDDWQWRIWTAKPDCANPGAGELCPEWPRSPQDWIGESNRLLFTAGHYDWDIYMTDADGSCSSIPVRPRPGFPDKGTYAADCSPDGSKIAYVNYFSGGPGGSEIYVGDLLDQNTDLQVTPSDDNPKNLYGRPVWSPNGEWIAYLDFKGQWITPDFSVSDLYIVKPDGTNRTLILSGVHAAWTDISWSPDSKEIAYTDWVSNKDQRPAIWAVNVADPSQRRLIVEDGCNPSWAGLPGQPGAKLELLKTTDKDTVQSGDDLTYALTCSNTGTRAATSVCITDSIPTNSRYIRDSATGPDSYLIEYSTDPNKNPDPNSWTRVQPDQENVRHLRWTTYQLDAGAFTTVGFKVRPVKEIQPPFEITNAARASSAETGPILSNVVITRIANPRDTVGLSIHAPAETAKGCDIRFEVRYWNRSNTEITGLTLTVQLPDKYLAAIEADAKPYLTHGSSVLTWKNLSLPAGAADHRVIVINAKVKNTAPEKTFLIAKASMKGSSGVGLVSTESRSLVVNVGDNDFRNIMLFPETGLIGADNLLGDEDIRATIYTNIETTIGYEAFNKGTRVGVTVDPRMYGHTWLSPWHNSWFEDTGRYGLLGQVEVTDCWGRNVASRQFTTDINYDQIYGDQSDKSSVAQWPGVVFDVPQAGVYTVNVSFTLYKKVDVQNSSKESGDGTFVGSAPFRYKIAVPTNREEANARGALVVIARDSLGNQLASPCTIRNEKGEQVASFETSQLEPITIYLPNGVYSLSIKSPFTGETKTGTAIVSSASPTPAYHLAVFKNSEDRDLIELKHEGETQVISFGAGLGESCHILLDNVKPGRTIVVALAGPVGFNITPSGVEPLSPENGRPMMYYIHKGTLLDTAWHVGERTAVSAITGGVSGAVAGLIVPGPGTCAVALSGVASGAAAGLISGVFDVLGASDDYTIAYIVIPEAPAHSYLFTLHNPWGHPWSSNTATITSFDSCDFNRVLHQLPQADLMYGTGVQEYLVKSSTAQEKTLSLLYLGENDKELEITVKGPNWMHCDAELPVEKVRIQRYLDLATAMSETSFHLGVAVASQAVGNLLAEKMHKPLLEVLKKELDVKISPLLKDFVKQGCKASAKAALKSLAYMKLQEIDTVISDMMGNTVENKILTEQERNLCLSKWFRSKFNRQQSYAEIADSIFDGLEALYNSDSRNHDECILRIPHAQNGELYRIRISDAMYLGGKTFNIIISDRSFPYN